MLITDIKLEYFATSSLQYCLQQHVAFCLCNDFDQILQTDKVTVKCCNCSNTFKVKYSEVALQIFCNDCKDIPIETKHLQELKERLQSIKAKLLV